MTKHESNVQNEIVDAIKLFFSDEEFGFEFPAAEIRLSTPASGAQAKHVQDFGRKPYDVAFYARSTVVIFLEIKERFQSGDIDEFKNDQHELLKKLFANDIFVPFAYNSVPFDWKNTPDARNALDATHVRYPDDMATPIVKNEIPPAMTLLGYLQYMTSSQGSAHHSLAQLLDRNIAHMDSLNSMPIMILAKLDKDDGKILIDKSPHTALKEMKEFFSMDRSLRAAWLAKTAQTNGIKAANRLKVATEIFNLRDSWDGSKQMTMGGP